MTQAYFNERMEPFGLGAGQQFFMFRIARYPGLSMAELSRMGFYDNCTATRAVKRLAEAGASAEELQQRVNALPFEIPEYNCVIGLWGQPEARVAYHMVREFCREHGLTAPDRGAMRYIFKRRIYDALCARQRGLDHPLYVTPKFYEGGGPFGMEMAAELMDELVREGVLIRREDGQTALTNWADFRFDFNI